MSDEPKTFEQREHVLAAAILRNLARSVFAAEPPIENGFITM
jgi:hypothetical protein